MHYYPVARGAVFRTYRDGRLRTVGVGFIPPTMASEVALWDASAAVPLYHMFHPYSDEVRAAAYGKVFFAIRTQGNRPKILVHQIREARGEMVFCGNSVAAAALLFAERSNNKTLTFDVLGPSGELAIEATVILRSNDLSTVGQLWHVNIPEVIETVVLERSAANCKLLNDYLLLEGPIDIPDISETFSLTTKLDKKVVIIEDAEPIPRVRFYNCNGLHGAAPQTGLATLSLALPQVDWLHRLFRGRQQLQTPSSIETLPEVTYNSTIASVRLPEVNVHLEYVAKPADPNEYSDS